METFKWSFTPHSTHRMSPDRDDIVMISSTARFGVVRECIACEATQAATVSGEAHSPRLAEPCPFADQIPTPDPT